MSSENLNIAHNRRELFMYYQLARRTGITLDVEGPPGCGKTEMIFDLLHLAKDCLPDGLDPDTLPKDWEPKASVFYLSQWTGEDLVGYPANDPKKGLVFIPPLRFRDLRPGDVCVFDEKTTPASPSSIKGMLQATQGTRLCIGDFVGPEHVTRITLGNRAEDGNVDYEANPVQGNRTMRVQYLGPTADEWLEWAIPKSIHPVVGTFIRMEGSDSLNAYDPEQDRSPTPRSWWNCSRALLALEDMYGDRDAVPMSARMSVAASLLGDPWALKLEAVFELAASMVPFSEIVAKPKLAKVPDPAVEPSQLFLVVTHVGNRCRPEHWSAVAQYIARLPIEMQGTAMAPILNRHPELKTTDEFLKYTTRTAGLVID